MPCRYSVYLNAVITPCRAECCTILLWFYVADRTSVFPYGTKDYSRDVLGFIFLGLTLVAFFTSLKQCRVPVLLNRQQTEEWKGWMQVCSFCAMCSPSVQAWQQHWPVLHVVNRQQ